jgi:hypothetical protein
VLWCGTSSPEIVSFRIFARGPEASAAPGKHHQRHDGYRDGDHHRPRAASTRQSRREETSQVTDKSRQAEAIVGPNPRDTALDTERARRCKQPLTTGNLENTIPGTQPLTPRELADANRCACGYDFATCVTCNPGAAIKAAEELALRYAASRSSAPDETAVRHTAERHKERARHEDTSIATMLQLMRSENKTNFLDLGGRIHSQQNALEAIHSAAAEMKAQVTTVATAVTSLQAGASVQDSLASTGGGHDHGPRIRRSEGAAGFLTLYSKTINTTTSSTPTTKARAAPIHQSTTHQKLSSAGDPFCSSKRSALRQPWLGH